MVEKVCPSCGTFLELLASYILFGDPALRLRLVPAAPWSLPLVIAQLRNLAGTDEQSDVAA
ncbi:MAG: hypothetical protein ACPL8I_11900, partial [Chloroflexaceae bacterium]